ncbi:hypothetical protein V1478_009116 [Vespula squamosa]|uniref:FLYWCH-type domain-containing protein n=1 Tax=Vespula squamosa TaxID=30214 RepID=A0ABD2ANQ7_VESSQ
MVLSARNVHPNELETPMANLHIGLLTEQPRPYLADENASANADVTVFIYSILQPFVSTSIVQQKSCISRASMQNLNREEENPGEEWSGSRIPAEQVLFNLNITFLHFNKPNENIAVPKYNIKEIREIGYSYKANTARRVTQWAYDRRRKCKAKYGVGCTVRKSSFRRAIFMLQSRREECFS